MSDGYWSGACEAWLESGHEGTFEEFMEWRVDTTPAEFGGAA